MTKVIKKEFEKLESLMINDVSLTCNTSLEIFNKEFNRMSRIDDDLFTYEVENYGITNIPCDSNKEDNSEQQMSHEIDDDMEHDPFDIEFTKWMIRFVNGTKMCHGYTKNHGLTLEYGLNPLQLSIVVSPLIIKTDVRSGLPAAREMMDTVMEETCLELT
uniref:Uncharacterized protein n=1 Tax=Tanacetum cinerariifolium TaxID=118510 RepID=A0A6L2NI40_TANCI|nr:hypothetical protein [Tanacetum cinerariifolium]